MRYAVPADRRGRSWSILLLLAAFSFACLRTIGPVRYSPLAIDEQVSYYLVAGKDPPSVWRRCLEQSATPPFFFWLSRGSLYFGNTVGNSDTREFFLRLPSFLSYLALTCIVWLTAERFIGAGTGGMAALLLATSEHVAYHATQARPYVVGALLSMVLFYLLVRLRAAPAGKTLPAFLTLAAAALLWTHYLFVVVFPAVFVLVMLLPAGRPQCLSRTAIVLLLLLSGLSALALATGVLRLIAEGPYLDWISQAGSWHVPLQLLLPKENGWLLAGTVVGVGLMIRLVGSLFGCRDFVRPSSTILGEWNTVTRLVAIAVWFLVPVYLLWFAGWLSSPSLAQSRYMIVQSGAAILLVTGVLNLVGGPVLGTMMALAFCLVFQAPTQMVANLRQPIRHDSYWKDAAVFLNEQAGEGDLVFTQTGLVETRFVPLRFADLGYQEYTTSRLSGFYLKTPLVRRSLPLHWTRGDWLQEYSRQVKQGISSGGNIWLVLSSDSDVGEAVEHASVHWLRSLGLEPRLVREERVARVYRAAAPLGEN